MAKQSYANVEEEKICSIRLLITGGELILDVGRIRQETEKNVMLARLKRWTGRMKKSVKLDTFL
jgi:hypothetical protein